jgi:hypothetical protein
MTADDLNAPLGQNRDKRRGRLPISAIFAGVLGLFLAAFVVWAALRNDPFGGEPMVVVPVDGHPAKAASNTGPGRYDGPTGAPSQTAAGTPPPAASAPAQLPAAPPGPPPNTKTISIIDGKTGQRQEVTIPGSASEAAPPASSPPARAAMPVDQKFVEMTPHGALPKIAADGVRPADAFAQPVKALAGKPDAPRIAIIVGGLGVSETATAAAIAELPGAVTLALMPYGNEVAAVAARARAQNHEILLQVPMEPFGYPDNDPGPQTLLTSLTPQQNVDRLYWVMSRFEGYVGMQNTMGARFTASEQALGPVLHEAAKRGLVFVDDASNPRSVAGRIASANNLPFAKADVVIDAVPSPAEIDRALGRLEMTAREHGVAVGVTSALPVAIDHVAQWAKALAGRGFLLVPITAVANKTKQASAAGDQ